jgi:hypothetical protein
MSGVERNMYELIPRLEGSRVLSMRFLTRACFPLATLARTGRGY